MSEITYCAFEGATWLFFGPNVAPLVYYSHLPIAIFSLLLGVFMYFKDRKSLANQVFFYTVFAFVIWVIGDSIYWASNRSDVIMFVWALVILVEPVVYIGAFYLLYVLVSGKDLSFKAKLSLGLLYLPIILIAPTTFSLSSFDIGTCLANEHLFSYYTYVIETIIVVSILAYSVHKLFVVRENESRKKILLLTLGVILFLASFAWGNIIGSFTEDWNLAQYGLFGMPVFMAFLVYSIVKFRLFNVKIIGASALMAAVWVATASLLAIQDIDVSHAVVAATLIMTTIMGWVLINSVRKEVALREELEIANEGQADLLHIINHQIKGYMTKARLAFDDLLNDSSYSISEKARPVIQQGFDSVTEGVIFVQDFLNASNIDKGTYTYNMQPLDFMELVKEEVVEQKQIAEEKGLQFEFHVGEGDYKMTGDKGQLTQTIKNLIDNSIKYTPSGSLKVSLERQNNEILFTVKDTGVGLSDEVKPKLFTKGGKDKDSQKININSTGYGLSFVKGVVEAHKGRVWAESEGPGKGSSFHMAIPVA